MSNATARPWRLGTDGNVWSGETKGEQLAIVHHLGGEQSVKPDNGRLIVQAVNSHDRLVDLARLCVDILDGADSDAGLRHILLAARAAITKATTH